MLYLNFSLSNPWYKTFKGHKDYYNLFLYHGKLSTNKHWEFEGYKDSRKVIGMEISLSWRGRDHAGLEVGLCLLGRDIALRVYDTRHWDYEKNTWVKHEDDLKKDLGDVQVSPNIPTSKPERKQI
jgi:hypothetical protein